MSTLVVQIPERPRLNARGDAVPGSAASGLGTEYDYVTTSDGLTLTGHGECSEIGRASCRERVSSPV